MTTVSSTSPATTISSKSSSKLGPLAWWATASLSIVVLGQGTTCLLGDITQRRPRSNKNNSCRMKNTPNSIKFRKGRWTLLALQSCKPVLHHRRLRIGLTQAITFIAMHMNNRIKRLVIQRPGKFPESLRKASIAIRRSIWNLGGSQVQRILVSTVDRDSTISMHSGKVPQWYWISSIHSKGAHLGMHPW